MNSKFHVFSGRISNIGVTDISKEKNKTDLICNIQLLDGVTQSFRTNKQDDGQALLDMVFNHLGVQERGLFGLLLSEEPTDSPRWLDPNKSIKKQLKGNFSCHMIFRVRFFIADPSSLQEEITRHMYFLQIKDDIQKGRLSCPLSSAVVLASYAVQSELGDYSSTDHTPGYLSSRIFLPRQDEDFCSKVEQLHPQHSGLKPSEAELCYLNTARTLDFYGVELHCARDSNNTDLLVGVASGGLAVFRNMICSNFFSWVSIIKISFKRKRFFVQLKQKHRESRDSTISFVMLNYRACKNLWKSCVEHHTFFQADNNLLHADRKPFFHHWTLGPKSHTKSLNSQILRRMMGGMVWNPTLRKSLSGEHLETRSLPSRSPPTTPSWRSPHLRRHVRKGHSSMDNLANEMSYLTETEEVFYTYKGSLSGRDSDDEARNCQENHKAEGPTAEPAELCITDVVAGVDRSPVDNRSDQYYCDKNEEIEGDLRPVRIAPDKDGKFGFNVKGGVDQKTPLVVSHVHPDSPASKCSPPLQEGDQIVLINGRDISEHTHDQVVMFIKASRESHTKELALLVRRKGSGSLTGPQSEGLFSFPLLGDPILPPIHQCDQTLEESMVSLSRGLETGTVLIQFEQLYRKNPGMLMSEARSAENMEKNRYKDVLPYDDTRVVLQDQEDNYINASHVKMEMPQAEIASHYVASQGPLPHTCRHFWQLIWEQHINTIVMLTTLTERGRPKCHQYWPDPPEICDYDYLQVCCRTEECNLAYVFREIMLTNTETGEERCIIHLQYVAWPDHGVPDDPSDFLDFVNFAQQKREGAELLLVHCSAGIGRTGVFITMETAMKLIEKDRPVYPLDLVRRMRDQRAMMVQTACQYRFVCEAILRVYREKQNSTPAPQNQSQDVPGQIITFPTVISRST